LLRIVQKKSTAFSEVREILKWRMNAEYFRRQRSRSLGRKRKESQIDGSKAAD
jgi:hypothetical protein